MKIRKIFSITPKTLGILGIIVVTFVVGCIMLLMLREIVNFLFLIYPIREEKKFIVPIPSIMEKVIEVKAATNTIVVIEPIGLGGGVGVGVGAPEIQCKTPEQFLELIPKDAKIYTSIEKNSCRTLLKRYLVFMEEKSGVFVYERIIKIEFLDPRQIKIINPDYKCMRCTVSMSFTDTEIIYSYVLYYKYK